MRTLDRRRRPFALDVGGQLTITHSAIVGNTALRVGGALAFSGNLTMTGSTIAGNSSGQLPTLTGDASLPGSPGATGLVSNSTVVGNAAGYPSALSTGGVSAVRLRNSIVAGNTARNATGSVHPSDCASSSQSLGNNLFGEPDGCGALLPSDRVGDPGVGMLIDPGSAGTAHVALLPGSQAIDAGDNAACDDHDQPGDHAAWRSRRHAGAHHGRRRTDRRRRHHGCGHASISEGPPATGAFRTV